MDTTTITNDLSALFDSTGRAKTENLKRFQATSFEKFKSLGLPTKKSEAYKFTPIEKVLSKSFDFKNLAKTSSWTKEEFKGNFYPIEEANHLIFIDGSFDVTNSIIKSDKNDLLIEILSDSNSEGLGQTSSQSQDPFAQLNGATFKNGLLLKSLKNSRNLPVFIYQFIDSSEGQIVASPRIMIEAENGSFVDIYEKTFTKGQNNILINSLVESTVHANGEARFTKLQNYNKNVFAIEGIYSSQLRDSRFYTNTYSFSGSLIRNNINIDIDGENCEGHMNGLYQLSGSTHVDVNTSVDHKQPNSYSNELYKGVLDEKSHGVFNGKIYVRPDAQKTNAFQSNNNILLTDTSIVNTKPQLEIWADDVKCSHGCTTGQLDEEAIFYLRSRGISKQRAKALMLNAFANETLNEVNAVLVKEEIENIITSKLG